MSDETYHQRCEKDLAEVRAYVRAETERRWKRRASKLSDEDIGALIFFALVFGVGGLLWGALAWATGLFTT